MRNLVLRHSVNVALCAIYMQYCFLQKRTLGKTVVRLLPAFLLPLLVDTLIGMPHDQAMPKGYLLHEIGFMLLTMFVFSLSWQPTPPAVQGH